MFVGEVFWCGIFVIVLIVFVLKEVCGDLVFYVDLDDVDGFVDVIFCFMNELGMVDVFWVKIVVCYVFFRMWVDVVCDVVNVVVCGV